MAKPTERDQAQAIEIVNLSFAPMTDEVYEAVAKGIAIGRASDLTPAVASVLTMLAAKRGKWAGLPVYRQILLARYATYSAAATEAAARLIDALEKMGRAG